MTKSFPDWLAKVNEKRKEYWDLNYTYKPYSPLTYKKGTKFVKIIDEDSVWGFVCMYTGYFKGVPVRIGDLMKAANWNAPAKHSRGNIWDGTDRWNFYGPEYLN
jgi:hypothetical protein